MSNAAGQLTVDPLFGSHMVLQRNQAITIWGAAEPNAPVSVNVSESTTDTRADHEGRWSVTAPPLPAGGPITVSIASQDEQITLRNVLIGDVWVCSGQSNMDWTLNKTDRGPEFIERASQFTRLRMIKLNRNWDREPIDDVDTVGWRESSPSMAARISGVGFHFGRIVNQATDVPIGLIHTAWGGTPAEAWTPMPALKARPDVYRARLDSLSDYDMLDAEAERILGEAQQRHEAFALQAWSVGEGVDDGFHEADYDDSAWSTITLPGWADAQVAKHSPTITYNIDGIIWMRKTVEVPSDAAGKQGELRLARVDDYDETWINGTKVGATRLDQGGVSRSQRRYSIPEGVLESGPNTIAVRLMDIRSSGGVIPGESYPFELAHATGTIPLAGDWKATISFDSRTYGGFPRPASHAVPIGRPFRRPAVLYNAMIHPLTKLGIAGVVWYQAESNSGRGDEYRELFPDMINAWRESWAEARSEPDFTLPFYFVQLPNYLHRKREPGESRWADLREAQRLALGRTEHTGMAITIDIGDPGDIHPTNKLPVGERLARLVLHDIYDVPMRPKTGPMPISIVRNGNQAIIEFEYADGLTTTDGGRRVEGVALAGDDGVFRWASAVLIDGARVIAVADGIQHPVRVRYAWADNPQVNLVNAAGLPASPFEADLK